MPIVAANCRCKRKRQLPYVLQQRPIPKKAHNVSAPAIGLLRDPGRTFIMGR
jgi:hypothetical protein